MAQLSVVIVTSVPFVSGTDPSAALTKVDGREVLLRSVELFLNRDEVKQVQLVVGNDLLEEVKRKHGAHLGFSGVKLVGAGNKFGEQIAAAAGNVPAETTHVLVHDAARCCVPYTDIDALVAATADKKAVTALSIPIRNGLVQLDEGNSPVGLVAASSYSQIVMPILFTKQKLSELATAKREPHASELTLLPGSPLNIRVAGPQDGSLAKAMLQMMPKTKVKGPSSPFEEAQW